ncbi:DUF4234 domain-containing protein [Companilactobacillus kedongensis]|uniref:DUF4234 domain-containing protein n=1 Tax=Companilactobacillus kedongensis TaxID=2486004 RepID=UPI000F770F19|nr:DUF4234 domain-containing protein [Companilactobacillus kedongensis]
MRQTRYKKKSHKKAIIITLVTFFVLMIIGVVFFFPLNNAVRTISGGNDTTSDRLVKDELVKKVESTRNGDPQHDKKVSEVSKNLKNTRMSDIMKSAGDQSKAAKTLHENTALSSADSKKVAKEVFSDSKYDDLRKSVSDGNWYSAYNQYRSLSNDGSITELKNSISK